MDRKQAIRKVREFARILRPHLPTYDIYLYGSYAKGRPGRYSDIDVAVRIFSQVPPDDSVVLLLQSPQSALTDVDPPSIGAEAEAHVKRDGLRAHLQHVRQRARILRSLDAERREVLGGQLERSRAIQRRQVVMARYTDPTAPELRVGCDELRGILHYRPDGRDRLKPLASIQKTFDEASLCFFRHQEIGGPELHNDNSPFNTDLPDRSSHRASRLQENSPNEIVNGPRVGLSHLTAGNQSVRLPLLDRPRQRFAFREPRAGERRAEPEEPCRAL